MGNWTSRGQRRTGAIDPTPRLRFAAVLRSSRELTHLHAAAPARAVFISRADVA